MENAEISYDLVMEDEMDFVEGTYRIPGKEWQVFIFSCRDVGTPRIRDGTWHSGITGVHVYFPLEMRLNQSVVEELLGRHLNVENWVIAEGPDSMLLR